MAARADAEASDEKIVALWLHGRSPHTQRAYAADARWFVGRPLVQVTLVDLQAFADALSLQSLTPASRARALSSVKSVLAFGHRLGVLPVDVGAALRLPSLRSQLAERILPEADVQRLLALEPGRRNRVLLRLLYAGGVRVSEVCALCWRNTAERGDAGQISVFGKGGKTRGASLPGHLAGTAGLTARGQGRTRRCSSPGRRRVTLTPRWY